VVGEVAARGCGIGAILIGKARDADAGGVVAERGCAFAGGAHDAAVACWDAFAVLGMVALVAG